MWFLGGASWLLILTVPVLGHRHLCSLDKGIQTLCSCLQGHSSGGFLMCVPPRPRGRTDEQASRVGVARHAESTTPSCLAGKPPPPKRPARKAETFCSAGGWSSPVSVPQLLDAQGQGGLWLYQTLPQISPPWPLPSAPDA